ncbi:amidohydrolase family protein, partial [Penicillium subrubescens]|uniref:amidohydrolase family protein n=1 Tax=Penicillium subrubescens TaxID=1316194 RepID=UPI002545122B
MAIPLVDSHVHLFPESHLSTLAWHKPKHPLASQHCLDEYRSAGPLSTNISGHAEETFLRGFIFIETDRISSVDKNEIGKGWLHVLDEISLATRIISGTPVKGDGHQKADNKLCLGFVPWAPIPGGARLLEEYFAQARQRTETERVWNRLCGARYLVQHRPSGVMIHTGFIDGVKWLGRQDLAFDLTLDTKTRGLSQLEEALKMMQMVYDGVETNQQTVIILDHLCKPNLSLQSTPAEIITEPDFTGWRDKISAMACFPKTYIKLSGAFSELRPQLSTAEPDYENIVQRLQPWTDVVFDSFGPARIMFGSDWPVCNIEGGGNGVAWLRWKKIVAMILQRRGCTELERKGVWGTVALKAYSLA